MGEVAGARLEDCGSRDMVPQNYFKNSPILSKWCILNSVLNYSLLYIQSKQKLNYSNYLWQEIAYFGWGGLEK